MSREQELSVGFANIAQVVLFESELKGQISDGNWENSSPQDHWKKPCNAKAFVAQSAAELGTDWVPIRYYNFADPELLDVVAERMIEYVKFYSQYHYVDPTFQYHHALEYMASERSLTIVLDRAREGEAYYQTKVQLFLTLFGVETEDELFAFTREAQQFNYTMEDLKRDLNQMRKIFHVRQSDSPSQEAQAMFQRYCAPAIAANGTASGGRSKRPYLPLAETMLTAGTFTKDEIVHLIRVSFPEVKKSGLDTFFTDLKNVKYSAFKPRTAVPNAVGKWSFVAPQGA
jgi:hypothetical protein